MDGKVLSRKPRGISRKSAFVSILCLGVLACLLVVSHDMAVSQLEASEGQIGRASPWVRTYVVMSHPVEDWERDLYDRSRVEGLTPSQLGNELSKAWGTSVREVDVEAWRERMVVDASSLELSGLWFYVPGVGLLRGLYRAYGEYTILLGASVYVAYYAYLKPMLGRHRGKTPE